MDLVTPINALVATLRSTGISADVNPADVNVPGAWVALDETEPATVGGGWVLRCSVYLIAPATDHQRAMELLGGLLRDVLGVLIPDGPVRTQGAVMPDDPTPLPALVVPVHLYT